MQLFSMNSKLFFLGGLFLSSASLNASIITFEYGGHGYAIQTVGATWEDANTAAQAMTGGTGGIPTGWGDAHLVIIDGKGGVDGKAESEKLKEMALSAGITTTAPDGGGAIYTWMGLHQTDTTGYSDDSWEWVDGRAYDFYTDYDGWGYAEDQDGKMHYEPDDFDGDENGQQDYAALGVSAWPYGEAGEWNDVDGSNQLAYIVEFDTVPEPSSVALLGLGGLALLLRRRK